MQKLITQINDNPVKWSNYNFWSYYKNGDGTEISLEQTGYLKETINHYFYELEVYERINLQILNAALVSENSNFIYLFENSYDFGNVFTGVKYSFGEAVVKNNFNGNYSIHKDYIAINGTVNYYFSDYFSDVTSKVEDLMEEQNITREEAIARLGESIDEDGTPYKLIGAWQTEFSAIIETK